MIKRNMIKDISALTGLTVTSLNDIAERASLCIAHSVYEGMIEDDNEIKIDIGIGALCVKVCDETVKYRFEPSDKLLQSVTEATISNTSPLLEKANATLQERIRRTYKEII